MELTTRCLLMKFLEINLYIFYLFEIWQVSMYFQFVEKQTETH